MSYQNTIENILYWGGGGAGPLYSISNVPGALNLASTYDCRPVKL